MTLARALQRYARRSDGAPHGGDRCQLCGMPVAEPHPHVVELHERALLCACGACATLFRDGGASGGRFCTVPDRVLVDASLSLSDADWAALEIPVQLAFIFFNSALGRWAAAYPSPAGAIESELAEAAWERLATRHRLFTCVRPDIEALLVRRPRWQPTFQCFLVPIDVCYQLVAVVRQHWRGFDGGDAAWRAIDELFAALATRSRPLTDEGGAHGRAQQIR